MMSLRVHICPVGFELDRLIMPLIDYRADRVYLITRETYDEKAPFFYDSIIQRLDEEGMDHRTIHCDMEDMVDVLQKLTQIIQREMEEGNNVHVNVSSGNKVAAIAGTMACMIWGCVPYFVTPADYAPAPDTALSTGVAGVRELPPYRMDRPSPMMIETLRILMSKGGSGSKKDVIKGLKAKGFELITDGSRIGDDAEIRKRERNRAIAEYRKLETIVMNGLLEWDLVEVSGRTRNMRVSLKENGLNALRIFAGEGS